MVDLSKIVVDGNFSELDQGRNALPVEDGAVKLDELRAVKDDFDDLLDLF